ncbi:cell division protein PerM [Actinomyces ruminicola]|uniref:Uncharacterized protein n=1 Tax=Actinomyces ruminicola TaxID=332524 RepID=A0A1G9XSU8_9ACTO|nr:DUF6350 family protein [Actinomyces ruminicola]SDM99889.1 hypothetical protein SAMN04487766_11074 [Actinomyces ruminicola]
MNLRERLRRQPPPGPGAASAGRALPADWPLAVRAGAESVVLGWGLVVLPILVLYLASSSRDAAAALSLGGVLRTGTGIWSLGFGGAMGAGTGEYGTLSLPLLGLTLLQVWLTRASVRRARLSGPAAGAITVGAAAVTSLVIVAATHPAASRTWTAGMGVTVLTAAVTAWSLQRSGRGWQAAAEWHERRPEWLGVALRVTRELAVVLVVLAGATALLGLIVGAGRVSRLHDVLAGGGLAATAGLTLLQLGWLPTAVVWALSWLAGPGFVMGTGSVFSPTRVLAGAVPGLPLLGGLPTAALGAEGAFLPFLIALAAAAVAWRWRTALRDLPLRQTAAMTVTVALALAGGVLLACLAASGQVGPGRMADVGPRSGFVAAIVALMVLVGVGLVAVLPHPRTRALTSRGVQATKAATSAAADSARERLKTRTGKR